MGSCVDVGSGGMPICRYFSDATEMSNIVENTDKITQIEKVDFTKRIRGNTISTEMLDGKVEFYYVSHDKAGDIPIDEAHFFYIYNLDQDIHYFSRKICN